MKRSDAAIVMSCDVYTVRFILKKAYDKHITRLSVDFSNMTLAKDKNRVLD